MENEFKHEVFSENIGINTFKDVELLYEWLLLIRPNVFTVEVGKNDSEQIVYVVKWEKDYLE